MMPFARSGQSAAAVVLITASVLPLAFGSRQAHAGDDLTKREVRAIHAALAKFGCRGGKFDRDGDDGYEVDDTLCPDGHRYEVRFSRSFGLIKIERE